ncbi:MAG: type IV pilus secretin PilQ [Desulfobacterales bacterium]|nr:type IV pilus secretin PilQ [Desulfobacterales bacterium]
MKYSKRSIKFAIAFYFVGIPFFIVSMILLQWKNLHANDTEKMQESYLPTKIPSEMDVSQGDIVQSYDFMVAGEEVSVQYLDSKKVVNLSSEMNVFTSEEKLHNKTTKQSNHVDTNMLESIQAENLYNSIRIKINTLDKIKDFKSFTLDNFDNPRIVFDLYSVKSEYKTEQVVPVNLEGVERIRHYQYGSPDRLRIVLDTTLNYLNKYRVYPIEKGLVIEIDKQSEIYGASTETQQEVIQTASSSNPSDSVVNKKEVNAGHSKIAYVKRLDFISEKDGKSTVVIGTSRPVQFEIEKVNNLLLKIHLKKTLISRKQQRPMITTRFQSAVDRITTQVNMPVKNESLVLLELREFVEYKTEQVDKDILIHFASSSIAPRPLDQAKLPDWKQTMDQVQISQNMSSIVETTLQQPKEIKQQQFDASQQPPSVDTVQGLLDVQVNQSATPDISSSKMYTGEKIALDFYKTDIKNVFRILKEVSNKNFAIDKDVTGEVTLSLDIPVPWDQVLDLVLKMNQLGKIMEGDIIRIATIETLKKEEERLQAQLKAEREAKEMSKAIEPLKTEFIPINYAKADELAKHIEKIIKVDSQATQQPGAPPSPSMPSANPLEYRGSITVDARTNQIVYTDIEENIKRAKAIIRKLDKVTPQVVIEAKIVEASNDFDRNLGIGWGLSGGIQSDSPNAGVGPQRAFNTLGGTYGYNMIAVNPAAATGSNGLLNFNFTRIAGTPFLLNAYLNAMETRGEGKVISSPKILTLDNLEAKIEQGVEWPYAVTKVADGVAETVINFKKISLELKVTPHITADNRISMRIEIKKDDVVSIYDADVPVIGNKAATTELLVDDGDTVVIGGIVKTNSIVSKSGVPILMDIPVLGWLFKTKSQSDKSEELLIFITPTIVQFEQRTALN